VDEGVDVMKKNGVVSLAAFDAALEKRPITGRPSVLDQLPPEALEELRSNKGKVTLRVMTQWLKEAYGVQLDKRTLTYHFSEGRLRNEQA
jgi:hypothetical protein